MQYLPANAQNVGARPEQQDAFGFSDWDQGDFVAHGGVLAVLADGMGGMDRGGAASRAAVTTFLAAYQKKTSGESIGAALVRSARAAHDAVVSLAADGPAGSVGTTLVAAVIHDAQLHWLSVGDSALYLHRGETFSLLNTPHNYGRELDASAARGEISPATASADPQRQALTSYLGSLSLDEIDQNHEPYALLPGDCLLVASDGLFRTLEEDEILSRLKIQPPDPAAALLEATLAKQNPHQDNVTILSIKVGTPQTQQTAAPITKSAKGRSRALITAAAVALLLLAGAWYWREATHLTAAVQVLRAPAKENRERVDQRTVDSLAPGGDDNNARTPPERNGRTAPRP
jgi:protein phosphatase